MSEPQPSNATGRATIPNIAKTLADLIQDAITHGEYEKAQQYAYAGISLINAFTHHTCYDTDRDRQPTTFTRPTPAFDTLFTVSEAMRQFPSLSEHLNETADQAMSQIRNAFYDCYLSRNVPEATPDTLIEDAPDDSMDPVTTGGVPN